MPLPGRLRPRLRSLLSLARIRRNLAKRNEVLRKAALDYSAGKISLAEYLRVLVGMRRG